jgi:hypothetical protein
MLPDGEFDEIRHTARRHKLAVGEWVRQTLRAACNQEPGLAAARKLKVVRQAAGYSFPTAEIRKMIAEIERGDARGRGAPPA